MRKTVHSERQDLFLALMRKARKNANLTQQELAGRLGKPQSFVAKYEGGERRLDVVEFMMIAEAIGTDALPIIRKLARAKARE